MDNVVYWLKELRYEKNVFGFGTRGGGKQGFRAGV
jgi:hypothetical protein